MTDPQVAIFMLSTFIFLVLLGFPIAFTLISMGVGFGYYAYFQADNLLNNQIFYLLNQNTYSVMESDVLVAIPLFLFMGYVVERANIVYRLFFSLQLATRHLPGSMAVAALATCAIFATASGMAAVFASLMCQLQAGDHVVSATALFGSCREVIKNIITRYGIEISFIDGKNIENWKKEIKPNTKIFFFETPSNPCFELVDIEAVCKLAKASNIKVIVDNILVSPVLQSPSKFGADFVVYSGTKHIDGQGRNMGGAILCSAKFREEILKPFLRHTGPCLSPFNAWTLSKGLETLHLRVEEQSRNAEKIVKFLSEHNKIKSVNYPFSKNHPQYELAKKQQKMGCNVLSFYIKGDKKTAFNFINNLKMIDICNNLGDT